MYPNFIIFHGAKLSSFTNQSRRSNFPVRSAQLEENEDLEAFPIFPGGVRYMPGKIRDKDTLLIFLQNFPEGKSTPNLACKSDAVFPKSRRILS